MTSRLRTNALFAIALVLSGCVAGDPAPGGHASGFAMAVVAAAHPLAAEAGASVLRAGGNAIDAASAIQWALNVVEPPMSGLGGGAFILLRFSNGTATFIDGREVAGAGWKLSETRLPGADVGWKIGVPGTLAAFAHAQARYGVLGLARTFEPAIALAEDGFVVDAYLANYLRDPQTAQKLASWPESAAAFYPGSVCAPDAAAAAARGLVACAGGAPLREGDVLRQPDLARTFRALRDEGTDAFYHGPIAEAIADTARARGGWLTADDLAKYAVVEREPLRAPWAGGEIVTAPPPAGGVILVETLGVLDRLGHENAAFHSVEALHLLIESMALGYVDRRAYLGDPAFVEVPLRGLASPEYLDERAREVDAARASPCPQPGDPWRHDPDGAGHDRAAPFRCLASAPAPRSHTSHFVVVDGWGNVATVTTTINTAFGSGLLVPGYGFLLNDELSDFDLCVTAFGPGQRPCSSMAPTILVEGREAVLALGASGGSYIPAATANVLLATKVHGLPIAESVAAGRVKWEFDDVASFDGDVPAASLAGLDERGHRMIPLPPGLSYYTPYGVLGGIGNVQAIARGEDGSWWGAADDRSSQGAVVRVEPADFRPAG